MARKTFSVTEIRDSVNYLLAHNETRAGQAPEEAVAFRMGAASVLEKILHDTGNYRGFGYLDSEVVPDWARREDGKVLRDGYDDSRRIYY